ncbi:MAG: UpxY family transcription antiterminator [Bacteroidales bacterium]|jgi:transcription antitermination factor NusG|nr:UpxY family transcription antiterminator [Bacteroidales bacterium]
MEPQWHVIHVLSRTEKKVAERLEKKGIIIYLPIQKQLRQWSDRKKWVEMVALSGYVFVKISNKDHLQVLQTPGVSRFLKHNNVPVYISDLELQRFRDFVEKAADSLIEFSAEKLPVGTFITIQTGRFKGFSGEVVEHKGKCKLTVELSNFGHFFVVLSSSDVLPQ